MAPSLVGPAHVLLARRFRRRPPRSRRVVCYLIAVLAVAALAPQPALAAAEQGADMEGQCPADPGLADLARGQFSIALKDRTPDRLPPEAGDYVFSSATIIPTARMAAPPEQEGVFIPMVDRDIHCIYASSRSPGRTLSLLLRYPRDAWPPVLRAGEASPWQRLGRVDLSSENPAFQRSDYYEWKCPASAEACKFLLRRRPF